MCAFLSPSYSFILDGSGKKEEHSHVHVSIVRTRYLWYSSSIIYPLYSFGQSCCFMLLSVRISLPHHVVSYGMYEYTPYSYEVQSLGYFIFVCMLLYRCMFTAVFLVLLRRCRHRRPLLNAKYLRPVCCTLLLYTAVHGKRQKKCRISNLQ